MSNYNHKQNVLTKINHLKFEIDYAVELVKKINTNLVAFDYRDDLKDKSYVKDCLTKAEAQLRVCLFLLEQEESRLKPFTDEQ